MRARLMTRTEFEDWFSKQRGDLYVRAPYDLVPCACGDVNCHGWRFVERRTGAVRALQYDAVDASA